MFKELADLFGCRADIDLMTVPLSIYPSIHPHYKWMALQVAREARTWKDIDMDTTSKLLKCTIPAAFGVVLAVRLADYTAIYNSPMGSLHGSLSLAFWHRNLSTQFMVRSPIERFQGWMQNDE